MGKAVIMPSVCVGDEVCASRQVSQHVRSLVVSTLPSGVLFPLILLYRVTFTSLPLFCQPHSPLNHFALFFFYSCIFLYIILLAVLSCLVNQPTLLFYALLLLFFLLAPSLSFTPRERPVPFSNRCSAVLLVLLRSKWLLLCATCVYLCQRHPSLDFLMKERGPRRNNKNLIKLHFVKEFTLALMQKFLWFAIAEFRSTFAHFNMQFVANIKIPPWAKCPLLKEKSSFLMAFTTVKWWP